PPLPWPCPLRLALTAQAALLERRDAEFQATPIFFALLGGQEATFRLLAAAGARLDVTNAASVTLLRTAAPLPPLPARSPSHRLTRQTWRRARGCWRRASCSSRGTPTSSRTPTRSTATPSCAPPR